MQLHFGDVKYKCTLLCKGRTQDSFPIVVSVFSPFISLHPHSISPTHSTRHCNKRMMISNWKWVSTHTGLSVYKYMCVIRFRAGQQWRCFPCHPNKYAYWCSCNCMRILLLFLKRSIRSSSVNDSLAVSLLLLLY